MPQSHLKTGRQGTWLKALATFFSPILLVFTLRWFVVEPFVIPSESMVPNLFIHDHIIVKKFSYGLKPPVGDGWLFKFKKPARGDVIVFRFPENRDVFYIKRLIGLPGDEVSVQNGQIAVNGKPWGLVLDSMPGDDDEFDYFFEKSDENKQHRVRFFKQLSHLGSEEKKIIVPEKSYFFMGDNRDQSHDSRFWGFVPEDLLVGQAYFIWLSCEQTLVSAPFICDPFRLRVERLFKAIN